MGIERFERFSKEDRGLRVVVVTFAWLIAASPIERNRDLKVVFAVEVYPSQGGLSGVVFHGV